MPRNKKKQRKSSVEDDDWNDDSDKEFEMDAQAILNANKGGKKKNKGKKQQPQQDKEENVDAQSEDLPKQDKKKKKKKGKSKKYQSEEPQKGDDDLEVDKSEDIDNWNKKKKKGKKANNRFEPEIEPEPPQEEFDDEEPQKKKKKKKKKNRKNQPQISDDDNDVDGGGGGGDLEDENENLSVPVDSVDKSEDVVEDDWNALPQKKKKKNKKSKKNQQQNVEAEPEPEPEPEDNWDEPQQNKKKKKKKKKGKHPPEEQQQQQQNKGKKGKKKEKQKSRLEILKESADKRKLELVNYSENELIGELDVKYEDYYNEEIQMNFKEKVTEVISMFDIDDDNEEELEEVVKDDFVSEMKEILNDHWEELKKEMEEKLEENEEEELNKRKAEDRGKKMEELGIDLSKADKRNIEQKQRRAAAMEKKKKLKELKRKLAEQEARERDEAEERKRKEIEEEEERKRLEAQKAAEEVEDDGDSDWDDDSDEDNQKKQVAVDLKKKSKRPFTKKVNSKDKAAQFVRLQNDEFGRKNNTDFNQTTYSDDSDDGFKKRRRRGGKGRKPNQKQAASNRQKGNGTTAADNSTGATAKSQKEKSEVPSEEKKTNSTGAAAAAAAAPAAKSQKEKPEVPPEEKKDSTENSTNAEGLQEINVVGGDAGDDGSPEKATKHKKKDKKKKGKKGNITRAEKRKLRSPICVVMGHVDTGKTKILDNIRSTNVQNKEVGGITQQIGATYLSVEYIKNRTERLKEQVAKLKFKVPGLLFIDTPGHESFSNLRQRGSSLCDIAVLVVDLMHGLEPQTIESLKMLKKRKAGFIVALNKIDRCLDWERDDNAPFQSTFGNQKKQTVKDFNNRLAQVQQQFAMEGYNTALYYENKRQQKDISLVPTSAHSGEGIPDLLYLICRLTQKYMDEKLAYEADKFVCSVMEVKKTQGYGTTLDVILSNGQLQKDDTIVVCGLKESIATDIRCLLLPAEASEMRVRADYTHAEEVNASSGIKVVATGLDDAVAGSRLLIVPRNLKGKKMEKKRHEAIEQLKKDVQGDFNKIISKISRQNRGVYVQASTLGSLEALISYLQNEKPPVPISGIGIGDVFKADVMRAGVMLEHQKEYALILAFNVRVHNDAKQLAEQMGVKIFTAEIIYHLFDQFKEYMKELQLERQQAAKDVAVFPVEMDILPEHIIHNKNPFVLGCLVRRGMLHLGTPICAKRANADNTPTPLYLGKVIGIQQDKKDVPVGKVGEKYAVKIDGGEEQKNVQFGRQFDEFAPLVSQISRKSLDALKGNFGDDLRDNKEVFQLLKELKSYYGII